MTMDFFKAVELRHSYRGAYTNDTVPESDIIKILDAGIRAPSGCNAQTTSFIVVTNPELRAKIAEAFPNDMTKTAPVLVMAITEKVTFDFGFDCEFEDYGAAVENILLAATALGYASCWLDGQIRLDKVGDKLVCEVLAEMLEVPKNKTVRTILPIGVPASTGKQAEKKPFDERVEWRR